jgi:hypothetical protein
VYLSGRLATIQRLKAKHAANEVCTS